MHVLFSATIILILIMIIPKITKTAFKQIKPPSSSLSSSHVIPGCCDLGQKTSSCRKISSCRLLARACMSLEGLRWCSMGMKLVKIQVVSRKIRARPSAARFVMSSHFLVFAATTSLHLSIYTKASPYVTIKWCLSQKISSCRLLARACMSLEGLRWCSMGMKLVKIQVVRRKIRARPSAARFVTSSHFFGVRCNNQLTYQSVPICDHKMGPFSEDFVLSAPSQGVHVTGGS